MAVFLLLAGTSQRAFAAGILTQGGGPAAPITSSLTANLIAAQQGAAVAVQAQSQLARVTNALNAMQNIQTAAHNLSFTTPSAIPDGLQTNGLVPTSGLAAPGVARPVVGWVGATTPTETSSAGRTNVNIDQTAAQAILSWNSFNVGKNTSVNFNQQNHANWVALNQINASGVPSQILGSIKAAGQVYLINPNGIIFGGSSQVNVGALVASSASISTSQFLANGIYSTRTGAAYVPSFTDAGGAVRVQAGASITTNTPSTITAGGGFVLLLGTQVQNAGAITTPAGQAELAAGNSFLVRPGFGTSGNPTSSTRGNEVAVELKKIGSSGQPGGAGLVGNSGIITATTGDITLAGESVMQSGVLMATTSVDARGTVHLLSPLSDIHANVTLTGNSLTLVAPDLSSTATALDNQRAALIAQSATVNMARAKLLSAAFNDLSPLNDRLDQSRIEIVSGGDVQFQGQSETVAQGGQIAVDAARRVDVETGATLDVSGSYGVALPMQNNDLTVSIQSFELRDSPQNRITGNLRASQVFVDTRDLNLVPASSGGYATDRYYTPGGLIEASGYLANAGHKIGEYTAVGGSITIATGTAGAVVAQRGSVFDIAGGTLQYQSGTLKQSYLLGSDGRIYNVNNAPSSITYLGVYDGFVEDHPHWGVSQTYANVLSTPSEIYQNGYTVGRDAGSLLLGTSTSIFAGTIQVGAINGLLQTAPTPAGVTDPYKLRQNVVAEPGTLSLAVLQAANLAPSDSNITFNSVGKVAVAPAAGSPIPRSLVNTSIFNAGAVNSFGLGGLYVLTNGKIDVASPLTLAPGAAVSLFGSSVNVAANLTANGGSVEINNIAEVNNAPTLLRAPHGHPSTGSVTLGPGAVIQTAGLWTNLRLDPTVTFTQAFINGGAVTLGSAKDLTVSAGSLIDASAGGVQQASATRSGGAGGAVSLAAGELNNALVPSSRDDTLTLKGVLQSRGYSAGGALTLSATSFRITNVVTTKPVHGVVDLNAAFFRQGFSAYNLNSTGLLTVDPGTVVNVVEPTYQFAPGSDMVATGANPDLAFYQQLNPLYIANPALTNIAERAGASFSFIELPVKGLVAPFKPGLNIGAGGAINVDPGQTIHLEAVGQMTINGSLTAPGGNIVVRNDSVLTKPLPGGAGALSIWFGGGSVVDASAQTFSASNLRGDQLSVVPAGGTITIGNTNVFDGLTVSSTQASIIIRKGAIIEASGAAANDRVVEKPPLGIVLGPNAVGQGPVRVESAGGTISLSSQSGVYNNGALIAAAGGADAAGGTLALSLESTGLFNAATISLHPEILTITQTDTVPVLPIKLRPGQTSTSLAIGTARISEAQIQAGGFGTVSLFARDALRFVGNVTLLAPQSISLLEGAIIDTRANGSVTINAPHVILSGRTPETNPATGKPSSLVNGFSSQAAQGTFTVNAALLDLVNDVRFGGQQSALQADGKIRQINLLGFGKEVLNSAGDLRLLPPTGLVLGGNPLTDLVSTGSVTLNAAEIYATGGIADVVAGFNPIATGKNGSFDPRKVLTITRPNNTLQTAPLSIGGGINFAAPKIQQGGVVWQPLGSLTFGSIGKFIGSGLVGSGDPNTLVDFLPGSFTSVSASGLAVPYGGTTDGVSYTLNGMAVGANATTGTVTIAALKTNASKGAVLDLNGGGTLLGEGFISGQFGSTDPLYTPLLAVSAGGSVSQPSLAAAPVYAIVPGPQAVSGQAVSQTGETGSVPAVGTQIIVPAGVPGLPAGTYTLLPSSYALAPGGYRVELDGAASLTAPAVAALPNGSYAVAGYTGLANTAVRGSLPVAITITPAAQVRQDAQYDEQSYSQFLLANAARLGAPRPILPADGGTLVLTLPGNPKASITNSGLTTFLAGNGGIGGTLQIEGAAFSVASSSSPGVVLTPFFDIYGTTRPRHLRPGDVALSAAAIDAFNAFVLQIGIAGAGANSEAQGIKLETGATLTAARVILTALGGGITLQSGSQINTLGRGTVTKDSTNTGLYSNAGASVLDVGNGYFSYGINQSGSSDFGPIKIEDGAAIYTDGSIAISTSGAVSVGAAASYGGRYLDLAVPEINVGDPAALGATAPAGLTLTSAVLQSLTRGVPGINVPPTQILVLASSGSLNFYGTTALDLNKANVQLVIDSPAIYGFGGPDDTATISAGTIVWNGVTNVDPLTGAIIAGLPGGPIANGAGSGQGGSNQGTLNLDAANIVFGYSNLDLKLRGVSLPRLVLGFSTVNLNAGTEVTANSTGTLAVYQSQAVYNTPGIGGMLNIDTPLLTTQNDGGIGFTAGNAINVNATGVVSAASLAAPSAGGEVNLTSGSILIGSTVLLPGGRLDIQATGNVTLAAGALIDLAGATSKIVDKNIHGFGGDLVAESASGAITQDAGSTIDVSAIDNSAGSIKLTATGAAGAVSLNGALRGSATGGYASGSFDVRARTLADFAGLNANLNTGGLFQARSFDIKQGDLTVGDGVIARNVAISVDGGSLTVNGTIDASGAGAGNIVLAAVNNLTLAGTGRLDARGTLLVTDSQGVPIAAENAPTVSLTTTNGTLTLATGAVIDLTSADGVARGDLELNVPRLRSATSGDANISATGAVDITGAATVAVNAFWSYNGLSVTGTAGGVVTQAYLDQIDSNESRPFIDAAAGNADLTQRVAGLAAYGSAFHVRPGVQIVSATSNGDLTVEGDLNLAGYRYGPKANPAAYGSGEPGVLLLRAGGNLNIYGSITDGFETPIDNSGTAFATGWVAYANGEPYGQNVVLPVSVNIAAGSSFAAGQPLNFAVPITGGVFKANAVAPVALTLHGSQKTSFAFVATSDILGPNGNVLFGQGVVVPAGTSLPNGAVISVGGSLPINVAVDGVLWPANTPFTVSPNHSAKAGGVVLSQAIPLAAGSFIPAFSTLIFVKGQPGLNIPTGPDGNRLYFTDGTPVPNTFNTRPNIGGTQGQIYPLAALLPAGDMSWSIQLVAGADTGAADPTVVQASTALATAHTAGNLTLADTHYTTGMQLILGPPLHNPRSPRNRHICMVDPTSCKPTYTVHEDIASVFSVVRTGTGALDLVAGGSINENSDYGVYTAGTQSAPVLNAAGANPYNLPQGAVGPNGTLLGNSHANFTALVANYQANYPTGGGNVLVSAQADLNGFITADFSPLNQQFETITLAHTDAIGSWLWRQGGAGQPGAWWIEFGALELPTQSRRGPFVPQVDGFQGLGTLGGGNLTVNVGGDAGGLNLAVGATGRVTTAGTLVQTGGGGLNVKIGGRVNYIPPEAGMTLLFDAGGVISDLRGNTTVSAASIGLVLPNYTVGKTNEPGDARILPALVTQTANVADGIDFVPGDSKVVVDTRGDLVLDGVGNPGTVQNLVNTTPASGLTAKGRPFQQPGGATSYFSLWSTSTSLDLFSAGGDVTPFQGSTNFNENVSPDILSIAAVKTNYYPPNFSAISQNGNIDFLGGVVELAPSPNGQLQLLAANSIFGAAGNAVSSTTVAISGAPLSAEATPFNPAISVNSVSSSATAVYSNFSANSASELLSFAADTPAGALHGADPQPALVYAGGGDIVDLQFGLTTINTAAVPSVQYVAAKPFDVFAGQDIVNSGGINTPGVFLNLSSTDVTTVTAGRDIIQSSFEIAGPGTLVVQAARNLYQGNQGTIYSVGPIFNIDPNNRNSGAGITVLAGVGAAGPDYAGFANEYLNPASTLSLQNAGAIVANNDQILRAWLQLDYGYTGTVANAYAAFLTIGPLAQQVFLRQLYFDELNASGLEFNTLSSVRYKSYLRGRDAISTLFPNQRNGVPVSYAGDLTLYANSGIHTDFGGAIQTLTPGGQTIIGVEGTSPPASAGFITQGSGDIDIYGLGSVLLGESRVLTTFGGNIVIWSAAGDINAGRGSKTTVDYAPLQRVYDNYGNISLSPTVPSSGAGIATLNPIPSVSPGNINLVAPLGTVDAGEAGIRVSGNLNIAALHVVNAANITVQGSSTGLPVSAAPNVGALTSAGNASGAALQAAEKSATPAPRAAPPSIWIVEILGYGSGDATSPPPPSEPEKKQKKPKKLLVQARLERNFGLF